MTPQARVAAAIDEIASGQRAEVTLKRWARANRYAGSKDRAAVRDLVFDCLRRWGRTGTFTEDPTGRDRMIALTALSGGVLDDLFSGQGYGPAPLSLEEHEALGRFLGSELEPLIEIPAWLRDIWQADLGEQAGDIAQALTTRAPVFLRVNVAKASMSQAIDLLNSDGITTLPHPHVETALIVEEGARKISISRAYLEGLVELQDAASQASITCLPTTVTGGILDYCAGGGGKALALAAWCNSAVSAWDIQYDRMKDIPNRAARAGAHITCLTSPPTGTFEVVFVDAPCSGSGTWRRDPEGKLSLTPEQLASLCVTQVNVLKDASKHVAPNGYLVYATCSVLWRENVGQIDAFLRHADTFEVQEQHQFYPSHMGDGFFVTVLRNQL